MPKKFPSAKCPSGKRGFATPEQAEDALISLWSQNLYTEGHAPIAVYKCEDCRDYHLTSRPPMNERLSKEISSGKIKLNREASQWERKWKS